MNTYISQVKKQLAEYEAKCGVTDSESILDLLWDCYLESNPIDDGRIRQAELALAPVFRELPIAHSDALSDLITEMCIAYQRAAFLEGIQVGFHLNQELEPA